MKKTLLSISLILIVILGKAQEEKSGFFNLSDHVGGFGGFSISVNKQNNVSILGEGAFLYRNFYLGGFGFSSENGSYISPTSGLEYNLSSSQGGFMIGAYSNTNKAIALFVEIKMGFGEAYSKTQLYPNIYEEYSHSLQTLIPKIGISYSPIWFMQIRLDAAYQFSNEFNLNEVDQDPFNTPLFGLGLYFGYF